MSLISDNTTVQGALVGGGGGLVLVAGRGIVQLRLEGFKLKSGLAR
jgi:hypothetical protein